MKPVLNALRTFPLLIALLTAASPSRAETLYREDFAATDPATGLPAGWIPGPPAHLPFFQTARDVGVFGQASPSMRVDLPLHTLNYWLLSKRVPLPRMDSDYTLRISLRVEQPDAAFVAEIVSYDAEGQRLGSRRVLNLVGQQDSTLRTYTISFRPTGTGGSGACAVMLGLPYTKLLRGGRFWVDDLEISTGKEAGVLEFYIQPGSVEAGEPVDLHVSSASERAIVSVFREAGGAQLIDGPRQIELLSEHPIPPEVWRDGCRWPVSTEIRTGPAWPSGVYTVKLDDGMSVVWSSFLIRGSGGPGRILVILPTDTDQAYNDWGGRSFYTDPPTPVVSCARPYSLALFGIYAGPVNLIRWLAREDIAYDVAGDSDLDDHPEIPFSYPGVMLTGHSEYWTRGMRSALEEYIAAGGSVISLSGNTCWWQTRVEQSASGRKVVCYKYDAALDPYQSIDPALVTTHWDEPPVSNPPSRFLGLSWREGGMVNWMTSSACPCPYDWLSGHGGYQVYRTDHWVFEGTGLSEGDLLGREDAIVGYEVDGAPVVWHDGRPEIAAGAGTPTDFTILGQAPCWNQYRTDATGIALMGIMDRGASFVWNGGSTGWCWGLARDPSVQRITRNLIDRLPEWPPAPGTRGKIRVFPNPASGRVTLDLTGIPASETIGLFSVTGRCVVTLKPISLGDGRSYAVWSFRDDTGRALPSGIYWARAGNAGDAPIVRLR